MSNWNFHGYVALPLEKYGRRYMGNAFEKADAIANGDFVNAMFSILSIKFGTLKELPDFVSLCKEYIDLPESKIPQEIAVEMFDEFKRLIEL